MSSLMLAFQIVIYGYVLWLGLYLIGRNPRNPRLALTGLGLVTYGVALGIILLQTIDLANTETEQFFRPELLFLLLPALFWTGVITYLLPETKSRYLKFRLAWIYGLFPSFWLVYILLLIVDALSNSAAVQKQLYLLFAATVLIPLFIAFITLIAHYFNEKPSKSFALILVITLFFGLGTLLLFVPMLPWLSQTLVVLGVGFDLILLGIGIAVLDAFDEGEALLPDFLRALDGTFITALLFAGPVALVIIFSTGLTFALLLLLLSVIAIVIAQQTFADQIETLIDQVAFASFPQLRQARSELRLANKTLPKINNALNPDDLTAGEFARLTRRALSHFGDLSRLATSPLTRLPLIDLRLADQGAADDTLERAAELKTLLTESIHRLKPRDKGDFGTSDEWRYYNALYFPYVVGLKPYSRRADHNGLDSLSHEALVWFQTAVPERTLYNWQTTAAKLIAQDLREQIQAQP